MIEGVALAMIFRPFGAEDRTPTITARPRGLKPRMGELPSRGATPLEHLIVDGNEVDLVGTFGRSAPCRDCYLRPSRLSSPPTPAPPSRGPVDFRTDVDRRPVARRLQPGGVPRLAAGQERLPPQPAAATTPTSTSFTLTRAERRPARRSRSPRATACSCSRGPAASPHQGGVVLEPDDPAYRRAAPLGRRGLPRRRPVAARSSSKSRPDRQRLPPTPRTQQLAVRAHFKDGDSPRRDRPGRLQRQRRRRGRPVTPDGLRPLRPHGRGVRPGALPRPVRQRPADLRPHRPEVRLRRARRRPTTSTNSSSPGSASCNCCPAAGRVRRGVPAPRLSRRDRHPADAGGGPRLPRLEGRRQAGEADRPAAGARRVRLVLGAEVGRRDARQPDDDQRARRPQLPPLPGAGRRRGPADRRVRPRTADRPGQHAEQAGRRASTASRARRRRPPRRSPSCSSASACSAPSATTTRSRTSRRPTTTAWPPTSPRCSARGRSSCSTTRSSPSRPGGEVQNPQTRKNQEPVAFGTPAGTLGPDDDRREKLADWLTRAGQPVLRPVARQPRLVPPVRPGHRRAGGRLPRHQPAVATPNCSTPSPPTSSRTATASSRCCGRS